MSTPYHLAMGAIKGTNVSVVKRMGKNDADLEWTKDTGVSWYTTTAKARITACPNGLIVWHQVLTRWFDAEPVDRVATITVCAASQLHAVIEALEQTHE